MRAACLALFLVGCGGVADATIPSECSPVVCELGNGSIGECLPRGCTVSVPKPPRTAQDASTDSQDPDVVTPSPDASEPVLDGGTGDSGEVADGGSPGTDSAPPPPPSYQCETTYAAVAGGTTSYTCQSYPSPVPCNEISDGHVWEPGSCPVSVGGSTRYGCCAHGTSSVCYYTYDPYDGSACTTGYGTWVPG